VRKDPSGKQPTRKIFKDKEKEKRYENIKNWSFILERKVQLNVGDHDQFLHELMRRNWMKLVNPMPNLTLKWSMSFMLMLGRGARVFRSEDQESEEDGYHLILNP